MLPIDFPGFLLLALDTCFHYPPHYKAPACEMSAGSGDFSLTAA